jgi:hypothetical protein
MCGRHSRHFAFKRLFSSDASRLSSRKRADSYAAMVGQAHLAGAMGLGEAAAPTMVG